MIYRYFKTLDQAKAFRAAIIAEGFRACIVATGEYEVRFWRD